MKSDYSIYASIPIKVAKNFLADRHYLGSNCKSGFNVGLYRSGVLVGVCIFTNVPTPELAQSMFGLERDQQDGLYELSRLCIHPEHQQSEHNLASWFVSRAIRLFRQRSGVKAILSYADADHHDGTVYRALNFSYYGKSTLKRDFWIKQPDGTFKKHNRGKTKGVDGEWRIRSQKHRFLMVFDKNLKVRW